MDEQMTITLRKPSVQDAPAIAQLQCVTWREAYAGIMPITFLANLDEAAFTANWRRALSSGGPGGYQVACVESAIIGFATYGPARDREQKGYGELVALNVLPEYWQCGVGARLFAAVEEAMFECYPKMYLWVAEGNMRAQAFYLKQGFSEFAEPRQSPRIEGVIERAMIKDLR